MKTTVIRPGILVALKSTVTGGVEYKRVDLDAGGETPNGASVARWETTRVIVDPVEHERAVKVRGKALGMIRGLAAATSFGLICPQDREPELDEAVKKARALVEEHNDNATCTRVAIYCLKGRIASTDEEAARAISGEVRSLLDAMDRGIAQLDVAEIREAASKAASLGSMLGEDQVKAVGEAVEQARKAARVIVKRIEKEGEDAAVVLADIQRGALEKARFAFLDLAPESPVTAEGEHAAPSEPALPAVDLQRFDFDFDSPSNVPEGNA
jgi:hypothetical protein